MCESRTITVYLTDDRRLEFQAEVTKDPTDIELAAFDYCEQQEIDPESVLMIHVTGFEDEEIE